VATARNPKNRGLPSINEARIERKRALVTGKAKVYGGTPQFWLWTALGVATFTIIYWKFAQGELESQKSALMSKQRAVAATLGPKITPFRDKIEEWVIELGAARQADFVADAIDVEKLRKGPGVYLRLGIASAKDAASIRDAAMTSLRDGFTSCLFVREETRTGEACSKPADCAMGFLCNEWGACARPSQPHNMRLAYRAMRVLTPEWTDELHQAVSDLAVRAFELDLAAVTKNDVPIAADVLTRARYFTVVLDEMPASGLPPPLVERSARATRS
jgi:hypothetical protein